MTAADLSHIAEGLRGLAVPIGDLREDPENARRHPERNLDEIRKSLVKFGQRLPIVVQRAGMVVRAGNGRLTVARQLGWTHLAAVICDDDDALAKAFGLMDNRSAELAEWDEEQLAKLLGEIRVDPALLDVTGFTIPEVEGLLKPPPPVVRPPDGGAGNYVEQYAVIVPCDSAEQQEIVYNQLRSLGLPCRVVNT